MFSCHEPPDRLVCLDGMAHGRGSKIRRPSSLGMAMLFDARVCHTASNHRSSAPRNRRSRPAILQAFDLAKLVTVACLL